ncbi:MAG: DUF2892 domain-containing protein [Spirochaetes bacterium]|nr:DUF2892 domain-containing protein [Spirochaetota bacterium]MBU1082073.1 DUF2892 domain-containing protein [Spirochaetota bacterium]
MPKNMGQVDRIVRLVAAIFIAGLFFTGRLGGGAAIVLGILGAVFVVTSVVGTCPLYIPFKIDTRGKKKS